jgi:hypothetical protein
LVLLLRIIPQGRREAQVFRLDESGLDFSSGLSGFGGGGCLGSVFSAPRSVLADCASSLMVLTSLSNTLILGSASFLSDRSIWRMATNSKHSTRWLESFISPCV